MIEEIGEDLDLDPYTTPMKVYTTLNKPKQDEINKILKGETLKEETAKKETTKEDIPSASEEQKMDETSKEEQKKRKKKRPNVILRMRKKIHEICIGHFFPKKIQGDVTFGFLDPYHTGQALAGLSMIYPFIGDNVNITPDFERRMLEGEIFLKGHIRIWHVVLLAGRLIFSKNVRVTYKHIRKIMKQRAGGT